MERKRIRDQTTELIWQTEIGNGVEETKKQGKHMSGLSEGRVLTIAMMIVITSRAVLRIVQSVDWRART